MLYTLKKKIGVQQIRLTQRLHPKWNFGHYNWVIEDEEGNILLAGFSSGGVKDKVTEKDLDDIFLRYKTWVVDDNSISKGESR